MTHIILEQTQYIVRIKNAYDNFKKMGDDMDLSSCKTRMKNLKDLWIKFENNNSLLFSNPDYANLQTQTTHL